MTKIKNNTQWQKTITQWHNPTYNDKNYHIMTKKKPNHTHKDKTQHTTVKTNTLWQKKPTNNDKSLIHNDKNPTYNDKT